jgi:hypothetical protein
MMSTLMSRMAVLAVAGLLVACGATGPTTATLSGPGGADGVVKSASVEISPPEIEPSECAGELALRVVDVGLGWTRVEAVSIIGKGFAPPCPYVAFTIEPDADLRNPRFREHEVIASGESGVYYLTAYTDQSKATIKITIK